MRTQAVNDARWIEFVRDPSFTNHKTDRWFIYAKGGGQLGHIQWYGAWRRYAFFPLGDTLFEATCLRDIATFLDGQMDQRRNAKKR